MKRLLLLAVIFLSFVLSSFAGKSPADYPLKVHILQQMWGSHNLQRSEYRATGWGNIWTGDSVQAFEFSYDCSFGLRRTARNEPYLAKWKKPQLRLALLAGQIGKNDKYQECELKTTVHEGVYVVGTGGLSEISQENYKTWKAKHSATGEGDTTVSSAASRLSIVSTPDGGEIEVDGKFMGNTPSVLELDPGEHSIAVRKPGYKSWEKKFKLAAGEVKLNAELEQDGPK